MYVGVQKSEIIPFFVHRFVLRHSGLCGRLLHNNRQARLQIPPLRKTPQTPRRENNPFQCLLPPPPIRSPPDSRDPLQIPIPFLGVLGQTAPECGREDVLGGLPQDPAEVQRGGRLCVPIFELRNEELHQGDCEEFFGR